MSAGKPQPGGTPAPQAAPPPPQAAPPEPGATIDTDPRPPDPDAIVRDAFDAARAQATGEPQPAEPPPPPAPQAKPEPAEPEPDPDPPPEKPLSARERFIQAAAADREKRSQTDKLKAREAELEAREAEARRAMDALKALETDPIGFIEARHPSLFERMVERYSASGGKPEKKDPTADLRSEIETLKQTIRDIQTNTSESMGAIEARRNVNEAMRLIADEEYAPIREYAALYEEMMGIPVDLEASIVYEHKQFLEQHQKSLTPMEVVEILKETALERLDRLPKSERLRARLGLDTTAQPPEPKPKARPTTGKPGTITAAQQAASATDASVDAALEGLYGEDRIAAIVDLIRAEKLPT